MEARLSGRTALITGGRRGIGRATALALARAGANIAVADSVNDECLHHTVEEIRGYDVAVLAIHADVSRAEDVTGMVKETVEAFGRIDILVNCAGVWLPGQSLLDCSEEDWDHVIDTNLKGHYLCCREAGRVMVQQGGGVIVNLSSQVGINPTRNNGAYPISKAGIIMLTQQLALELGHYGIRVNAVAPGIVKTDFNRFIWDSPESSRKLAEEVPLRRLAEPEDIAQAILFLVSDTAGYITGAVLPVDGGWRVS